MELYPGVVGHRKDSAFVEFPSSTWGVGLAERHSVPRLPRIGPAGQIHSHEFEKGIPALRTMSGSPCSDADIQKAAIFRLQQPAGTGLWMSDSMPQSGGTLPEGRDQADPQRTGTPQNHVSGGNVWPALTSRGHFSRVSSGPSFHMRTEPSSGPNVVNLLASVHLFTSGGRVALGTSDLLGSAPSSSLVPPPSLCSLLPVRPSP